MQSDTPPGDAPTNDRVDARQEPYASRFGGPAPEDGEDVSPTNPVSPPQSLDGTSEQSDEGPATDAATPQHSSEPVTAQPDADILEIRSEAAVVGDGDTAPVEALAADFAAGAVDPLVVDALMDGLDADGTSSDNHEVVTGLHRNLEAPGRDGDNPRQPHNDGGNAIEDREREQNPSAHPGVPNETPAEGAPADRSEADAVVAAAVDESLEAAPVADPPRGSPRLPLPRVLAVANQKGGVGKTTTTVNVAACLAELGHRTLLVDLDPQANATTGLGLDPRALTHSVYHVMLHNVAADSCIEPTEVKNLFVLPSSLDLAGAEIELVPALSREHRLRVAIESVIDDYDYVLIDCPPSLGLLTINALTAAKEILVPIQCEYYALEGLGQLLHNVELVTTNLNPTLQISHIVLVMFDSRTKLAGQVVDEVREHFGEIVCENVIPRTVRLSEAPSFGQPITTFDTTSTGAAAYRAVTKEVVGDQT